ncbi:peptidoglycan DD-metalloendopeptidase family protein [Shewanella yunxiaonensis]|uniref:Peptidoglycan DD-metalloendopeptidase family protein n=1 Tax=Shewanella yunxiaonensis TaxID=2829809 RepID=A0ABX7Z020_9GAMM|nr:MULTISPECIES: peptidoglycan DD-metalloendopeptidase family protein [Shewanella]MDF0533589.1 peptidoglycan DD-metalloendopeptidase family protein [Shewanella sp. A32]QUN07616.1 peptidoglycan DD-metalloendopeptidase family protein [Shewanella yunxiaonensis]
MQTEKISWLNFNPMMRLQALPSLHKKLLLTGGLAIGIAMLWPASQEFSPQRVAVPLDVESILTNPAPITAPHIAKPSYVHTITSGDTLSALFSEAGVDQQTMYKVLEADLDVLALDTLMPGNRISFWQDEQGNLTKLELYFNAARQVVFTRYPEGGYEVNEINIPGDWQDRIVSGDIQGSFYRSAEKVGLSAAEIQRIEMLLKDKLNFARDLRAGDNFSVLLNDQYVAGESTGVSHLLGISINLGRSRVTAFQDSDGNFYDENGQSLVRAFQRLPLLKQYRISSAFNPHRLHPVTGRIAPHNGVDFSTPVGTKVVATGDGVVTLVTNHPYAGKYIVIEHDSKYTTRYLHLSKALVHKGQRVSRGQVIALSGATGRITGPHLHYEFHINGRPVNPMTAQIPMAGHLAGKDKQAFEQLVASRKHMMNLG